jgi:Raf kinase inhibitor-like YbhB/YbcL family protein
MTGKMRNFKSPVFYCIIAMIFCICLATCGMDEDVSPVPPLEEPAVEKPETVEPQPSPETTEVDEKEGEAVAMDFLLTSSAFKEGEPIPARYTCEGENLSPYLSWAGAPDGTVSFALIVEDPDAPIGVFTHWILFNIPSSTGELKEGTGNQVQTGIGALHGKNDMNKNMYGGPCPPPGKPHRYQFTLYALDTTLDLAEGISRKQALAAIEGHVLAQNTLTGTFGR